MSENIKYAIALSQLKGVGSVTAKKLLSFAGSYSQVFKLSKKDLLNIDGVGTVLAHKLINQFNDRTLWTKVDNELAFIDEHNIDFACYKDKKYPYHLAQCEDGPIVVFSKGNIFLNNTKLLSIVGTRNITEYGKEMCEAFVKDLADLNIVVISGLAYGVDSYAHKMCVKHNIQTVGVLAHGLDRIYPATNRRLAQDMCDNGGLMTEFISGTNPDRENFPKRNRIIAGLADATLVIESASKGGSLITAEIANSYSRDVFAIPGRIGDDKSAGCNYLIRNNKAHLVENVKQLTQLMGWDEADKKPVQKSLFIELTPKEEQIITSFANENSLHIDQLAQQSQMGIGQLAMHLLEMEFKGLIKPLPGKIYKKL